jgi:hypothetical protein
MVAALERKVRVHTFAVLGPEFLHALRVCDRGAGILRLPIEVRLPTDAVIVVDEASRAPDSRYHAVRPMLAVSGGRLMLMSAPWGKRGFFHHEWTDVGDTWWRPPGDKDATGLT